MATGCSGYEVFSKKSLATGGKVVFNVPNLKEPYICVSDVGVRTLYWNAQSISNKLDYILKLLHDLQIDVLFIVEHWLTYNEIKLIKIPGYYLGDCYCRPIKKHGGSAIFIKDALVGSNIVDISSMACDFVFEISTSFISSLNVLCVSIYRVPEQNRSVVDDFLNRLYEFLNLVFNKYSNLNIILAGDFNIDTISNSNIASDFLNVLGSFGLRVTVNEPTRSTNCIDNVITSIHSDKCSASVFRTVFSDHDAILFLANLENDAAINSKSNDNFDFKLYRPINDFTKSYFIFLLRNINWIQMYTLNDINDKVNYFLYIFQEAIDKAFPLTPINSKNNNINFNKWYTPELRELKSF